MTENETQENPSSSELDQVLARLTVDQVRFVVARQDCLLDKDAAEAIGVKPNRVSQWKHSGTPIDEAVQLMALDGLTTALHLRRRSVAKAMAVKAKGLDSEDERLRQGVATEIIEWELGKATQRQELTGKDGDPIEQNVRDDRAAILGALCRIADRGSAAEVAEEPDGPAGSEAPA